MLLSMGICPKCQNGHNTPCFARYSDGVKCFSCGYSSKNFTGASLNHNIVKQSCNNLTTILPAYTQKVSLFSLQALEFLANYHIHDSLITKFGLGYCFSRNSLLYPLLPNYTQERFLAKKGFKTYGKKPFYITQSATKGTILIVEDFLSCVRLGEHHPTICLFGTSLPLNCDWNLLNNNTVIIWLDGDDPGQTAAKKIQEQIKNHKMKQKCQYPFLDVNMEIRNIKSSKDPKKYTDIEIKDILCSAHVF